MKGKTKDGRTHPWRGEEGVCRPYERKPHPVNPPPLQKKPAGR